MRYADQSNSFALHEAYRHLNLPIKIVKDIYYSYPQAAFAKDENQHTPIFIAVDSGFEDAMHLFVLKLTQFATALEIQPYNQQFMVLNLVA